MDGERDFLPDNWAHFSIQVSTDAYESEYIRINDFAIRDIVGNVWAIYVLIPYQLDLAGFEVAVDA